MFFDKNEKYLETGEYKKCLDQKQEKTKSVYKQEKNKCLETGANKKPQETGENKKCLETGENEKCLQVKSVLKQVSYNVFPSKLGAEHQSREAWCEKLREKFALMTIHPGPASRRPAWA